MNNQRQRMINAVQMRPTVMATTVTPRRKSNFTEEEESYLIQQYEMYKSVLSSRGGESEIWTKIANKMNGKNPSVARSGEDIEVKWCNMVRVALMELTHCQQQQRQLASAVVATPSEKTSKILKLATKICVHRTTYGDGNTAHLVAVEEGGGEGEGDIDAEIEEVGSSNIDMELKKANLRRIKLESKKLELEGKYLTKKMAREFP